MIWFTKNSQGLEHMFNYCPTQGFYGNFRYKTGAEGVPLPIGSIYKLTGYNIPDNFIYYYDPSNKASQLFYKNINEDYLYGIEGDQRVGTICGFSYCGRYIIIGFDTTYGCVTGFTEDRIFIHNLGRFKSYAMLNVNKFKL